MRAKRILRFEGQELGAFSVQQLIRMAERGLIDHTSEYWSEKVQEWRPLSNLISDLEGVPDHLEELSRNDSVEKESTVWRAWVYAKNTGSRASTGGGPNGAPEH